jgi:alkanesulfonate monooxygenase SsuD/methylene tetrahydromethanopterin reductase-like flavin-dependent oxidoreductase (luciferase family)
MDVGIFYEIQVASPLKHREREAQVFHQVMDQIVAAEQAGFDSFWTVEHHFQPGFSHCSAPEVLYGAVSQRTSVMRIGHAVVLLPFPYNHPVRVAERVATLDILSGGRVEMGTGRSITVQELGGFGIPHTETRARWEEALEIITKIWTSPDGTFSHKGPYFDIPERTVVPLPVQDPHPPIWMACTNPDSHEYAGERGLGLLSFTVLVPPDELGRRVARYRDGLTRAQTQGRAVNGRAGAFSLVHCADTDAQARADAERAFLSYTATQIGATAHVLQARRTGRSIEELGSEPLVVEEYEGIDPAKVDLDFLVDNGMCVVGDPDTCIRQMEHIRRAAGLDLFLCMMQFWPIPHERTMRAIELFGRHVIPHFKAQR